MQPTPNNIVELVKDLRVVLSGKARGQLDKGEFDTDDLIHSIVHGSVVKKEKDETKQSRYKYTIIGPSQSGTQVYSCGKPVRLMGEVYFVITFHEAR